MDALMQYDGSSDEEDEEMDSEDTSVQIIAPVSMPVQNDVNIEDEDIEFDGDENSISESDAISLPTSSQFNLETFLPPPKAKGQPSSTSQANEIEGSVIPPKKVYGDEEKPEPRPSTFTNLTTKKTASGVVQISIPSLKNFANDHGDQPKKKIFQGSQKASGLFALLPEPKNDASFLSASKNNQISASKSVLMVDKPGEGRPIVKATSTHFVPHAVKQGLGKRPATTDDRLEKVKAKFLKQEFNVRVVSKSGREKVKQNEDDSEDDDETSSDFFSFNSNYEEKPPNAVAIDLPQTSIKVNHQLEEYVEPQEIEAEPLPTPFEHPQRIQPEQDLMKYIQPSKKGKGKGEINIIDVSADDLRPQSTDWLKTITDTAIIPPRKAVLPGGMMKRKHQITYLAAEAKAREEELQNQWASNRQARRHTQNKYGF